MPQIQIDPALLQDGINSAVTQSATHSDAGDATTLNSAQTFATNADTTNLAAAKSYSDAQDISNLNTAKTYADTQDASNLIASKTYTDTQTAAAILSANGHTDIGDAANLMVAKAYTDSAIAGVTAGFKGSLAIADASPTVDGIYYFSQSGVYTNFGTPNKTIDLTQGLVYGTKLGSVFTAPIVIPVSVANLPLKRFGDRSLAFKTGIIVDRIANTITMPTFYYTKKGSTFVTKTVADFGGGTAFTFPIQTNAAILDTLYFDATRLAANTNPFYIETAATVNTWDENKIMILQMIGGEITNYFPVNDTSKGNLIYDKYATIIKAPAANSTININTVTKNIEVTNVNNFDFYIDAGANIYQPPTGNQTNAVITNGVSPNEMTGVNTVFYQISTKLIKAVNNTAYASIKTNDYIPLATFFASGATGYISTLQQISYNGISLNGAFNIPNSETLYNRLGTMMSVTGNLKVYIDSSLHTVRTQVTDSSGYCMFGADYYNLTAIDTTQNWEGGTSGLFFIYYDRTLKYIRVFNFASNSVPKTNNFVLLGWFNSASANTASNSIVIVSKGFIVDGTAINSPGNNNATGELILAPKIWLISGQKLPLYKSCIIRNEAERADEFILANKPINDSDLDFTYPTYESFIGKIDLDSTRLKPTVTIFSKKYQDTGNDYGSVMSIVASAANLKTGLTKVWNSIGDSLTNRGVVKWTKSYLTAISSGLTLTDVGTMTNTGFKGEGREGWTFANMIGRDNKHLDGTVITRLADGSTTSTLYQNPFLKVANSTDTTNHPTWCFRNTGADAELSYATDTDHTGNFYVFDYTYYMTQHSIATPDLVTIALSTNDMTVSTTTGVADCLFGIEVMLTQIKAAVPSAKIGIIPATGQGDNSTVWPTICDWINQLNLKLTTLAFSNVETIGIWMHLNKSFSYPYTSNSNLRSDGNKTQKYVKGEAIHFSTVGYFEYAKALSAYIIAVI